MTFSVYVLIYYKSDYGFKQGHPWPSCYGQLIRITCPRRCWLESHQGLFYLRKRIQLVMVLLRYLFVPNILYEVATEAFLYLLKLEMAHI